MLACQEPRFVQTARAIAGTHRPVRARLRNWWTGEDVDRAWSALRAASQALVEVLHAGAIRVVVPEIEAAVQTYGQQYLGGDPVMAEFTEWRKRRPIGAPFCEADRRLLRAALARIDQAATLASRRLRRFRNVLLVTLLGTTAMATGLAIVGMVAPEVVPVCAEAATAPPASGSLCPAGSDTPTGADILLLELFGMLGGALAGSFAIRRTRLHSNSYGISLLIALLQLPAGALTAVVGVLLIRGQFIPAFYLPRSPALLAYAFVLGFASLLVTRSIYRQATILVESAPGQSSTELVVNPGRRSHRDEQLGRSSRQAR